MSRKVLSAVTILLLLLPYLAACGSDQHTGGGETITYWASNQGPSIAYDNQVLSQAVKDFKAQTGITVKFEVISWSDLFNRILTADFSGQNPGVQHRAASLQFVKFMTSTAEQIKLNEAYTSLPVVKGAYSDPTFQTPDWTQAPFVGLQNYGIALNFGGPALAAHLRQLVRQLEFRTGIGYVGTVAYLPADTMSLPG